MNLYFIIIVDIYEFTYTELVCIPEPSFLNKCVLPASRYADLEIWQVTLIDERALGWYSTPLTKFCATHLIHISYFTPF